ncbi:hypothetical protein Pelo_7166 [Pelomyxa schiedti]|nr:hypothetical protein Pelo_7166 [Pelomyxa schiedti]
MKFSLAISQLRWHLLHKRSNFHSEYRRIRYNCRALRRLLLTCSTLPMFWLCSLTSNLYHFLYVYIFQQIIFHEIPR